MREHAERSGSYRREDGRRGSERAATVSALAAVIALVGIGALPAFLTTSLAPEIRTDFEFSDTAMGVAVGGFFLVSALASAPAGRLVSRIGAGAAVRASAGLTFASAATIAAVAGSAPAFAAGLALGGLSNALTAPAASRLLARALPERRLGVGYGALTAGAPVGAVFAGLALPLVAQPLGWRAVFVITAGLAVAVGAAVGRERASHDDVVAALPAQPRKTHSTRSLNPSPTHVLAVAAALASTASTGLISFLVVFSISSGISASLAGGLLAATGLIAAVSRIGLGVVADRIRGRACAYVLALFTTSCFGFLLLATGEPVLIAAGALIAGGLGWAWIGLLNLIAVRDGRYSPEQIVGITMSGLFTGALLGPPLVGLVSASLGFEAAWLLMVGLLVAAAGAVATAAREVQVAGSDQPALVADSISRVPGDRPLQRRADGCAALGRAGSARPGRARR